jgi:hypothetical protein
MLWLPSKEEAKKLLSDEIINSQRLDRQRGTNCEGFYLYFRRLIQWVEREMKFFAKRWFIRGVAMEELQEEYTFLKKHFGTIVPNQAFFKDPSGNIVAICSPVMIKSDIFNEHNRDYILEIMRQDISLQNQVEFFIQKHNRIADEGRIVDLFGDENLVISEDNKLHYVDSFIIFAKHPIVAESSKQKIAYLVQLLEESRTHLEASVKQK